MRVFLPFRQNLIALVFCLGLLTITTSCGNNPTSDPAQSAAIAAKDWPITHFSSIPVDSFLAIPLGRQYFCYDKGFNFSPLQPNRIWITPENLEAFELDLATGKQTPFSEKFGHDFFKKGLRTDGIYLDSVDHKLVWFLNFHTGVLRYDFQQRQSTHFPLNVPNEAMTAAAFSKNHVWIGSSRGLWMYNRQTGTFNMTDNSPEIWVRTLRVESDGKINVNSQYRYDPANNCWENYASPSETPYTQPPNPVTQFNLPYYGRYYLDAWNNGESWYINNNYWFSRDDNSEQVRAYRPIITGDVMTLRVDSDNLYLQYPDTFLIVSKEYLKKARKGDPELGAKLRRFKALSDSLKLYSSEDSWSVKKDKIAYAWTFFSNESDPYIRSTLNQLAQHFTLPDDEGQLRALVQQPGVDTVLLDKGYSQLMMKMVLAGKLRETYTDAKKYQKRRPDAPFFKGESNGLSALETSLHQMDSIDRTAQPVDEKQWAKGQAMEWFCTHQRFFSSEACYNYWLADSIYRLLVKQYPESSKADNAAFQILIHEPCHEGEDGSDHPEEVPGWRKFLQRYQNSDLRAEALCALVWAMGRKVKDLREGLKLLAEAERLKPALFDDQKDNNQVWVKLAFQRQLDWQELEFNIQLVKTTVKKGEPVQLQFLVKNTGIDTKKIRGFIDPAYPNFALEITPEGDPATCMRTVPYLESKVSTHPTDEKKYGDRLLAPGKTYTETWDISKTAIKYNYPNVGRFVFDQPGVYVIKATWLLWEEPKSAEVVRLVVE